MKKQKERPLFRGRLLIRERRKLSGFYLSTGTINERFLPRRM